jgi:hypothetical protein
MHDTAVRRCVRGGRAHSMGARAPDLLELSGGDISAIVSSNGGPELLTTSLVNGAKAVGVDNLRLVGYFSVDTKSIIGFGGVSRSKGTRFWEQDLVLVAARRSADRSCSPMRGTASIAHRRAMAR